MSEPLLCRLGFHKWRNYGNEVEVFWQTPAKFKTIPWNPYVTHSKVVYEGRECKRCGLKLRRKFVKNPDGAFSSIGWESETEETDKE